MAKHWIPLIPALLVASAGSAQENAPGKTGLDVQRLVPHTAPSAGSKSWTVTPVRSRQEAKRKA